MLMWQIGLQVYVRTDLAPHVDQVRTGVEATGLFGVVMNKGGVAVGMRLYGHTTLCVIASHLAAHMKHASARDDDAASILNGIGVAPVYNMDADAAYQHVIWVGDLNYRVDLGITRGGDRGREDPERWSEVQALMGTNDWPALVAADQLRDSIAQQRAFTGFSEAPINFCPTFKVKRLPGFFHTVRSTTIA